MTCVLAPHIGVPPPSFSPLPPLRSSRATCLDDDGVARLAPQQLDSYLYWYVQKLQEEKRKIKMTERLDGDSNLELGKSSC